MTCSNNTWASSGTQGACFPCPAEYAASHARDMDREMSDSYVHKDKLIFELNNENVQLYNDNEELVSSHKTISKQLNEGSFTHVKMNFGGWFSYTPISQITANSWAKVGM